MNGVTNNNLYGLTTIVPPNASSHNGNRAQDSGVNASIALSESVYNDSTQTVVQHLPDRGIKVSDHGLLEKPISQRSQMAGNTFHSSSSGIDGQNNSCYIRNNEGIEDRLGIWKAASNPDLAGLKEQKNHFTQNLQMQRTSDGPGNDSSASRDVLGNIQQHLANNSVEMAIPQLQSRDGSQILESYASNNGGKVMAESFEMGNSGKENSSDSFRSKFSPESFTSGFKENTQVNARNLSMLPGGKETQSPSRSDGLVRDGLNQESPNNMLHFGQTMSQGFSNKNHLVLGGAYYQQINPQSLYSQYGAFNNGLGQSVNDTGRFTPFMIREHYSSVGNLVDGSHSVQSLKQLNAADPGHVVHMQQMSDSAPEAETPLSESLPHGATYQLLKVDIPTKRKTATSVLPSWNKEIMEVPKRLKTLSEVEVDWARATNRFAEKVEFETLFVDGAPVRSKKRLIYTTQLMQQLFRPPPARAISLVASSNYEFVAYSAAKAVIGDACSSTSTDKSERFSPTENSNPLSERTKAEKINDQYISKAAEDLVSRTKKLETDFAGLLENGTTIADLRVQVQDLERFAVINRFARFHPPPSMDRTMGSFKLNPQRNVSIAPMPRNIPNRVQCLTLSNY